ncbi:serine protease [Aureococcus anophagefferens]|nr:serine protease [Aureococcus anophagefferens]
MSAWWSDLSATQELLARLDAEEGRAPVDDDDRDDLEPTATPATPDTPRRARNEFHVDLARGAFEPQLFLSIRRAYEQVLGMIIRPPRAKYDVRQLGPPSFAYGAARGARAPPYVRDDFFVANARGLRVACSLWRPAGPSEVTQAVVGRRASCLLYDEKLPLADSPTLIYLHGNASCRVEACTTLSLCCGLGLSVCAIDCSGSGASDGEYISLGLYEAEDVVAVVDHLKRDYGLNRYGLWGRSMGSVTALLYASGKAPDAPASSPTRPSSTSSGSATPRPRRAGHGLLLIHGRDDDFIKPDHSDAIEAAYGGKDVRLLKPLGGHNSRRSFDTYRRGAAAARGKPARANDAEFVSGMSEARQKEVEAGIGTLFGAGKKGK